MKAIFLLRYSVAARPQAQKNAFYWRPYNDKTFDAYCAELFDAERLAIRERLMTKLVIPSIAAQVAGHDVALHLYTSTLLPERNRAVLARLETDHPWIQVIAVGPDDTVDFSHATAAWLGATGTGDGAQTFATIRIDDDDGLSRDFLARLDAYATPAHAGMAVSFPRGLVADYDRDKGQIFRITEMEQAKNAQGLAFINRFDAASGRFAHDPVTVFDLGNHQRVDRVVPTITDARRLSYLRIFHADSVSYKPKRQDELYRDAELLAPTVAADLFEMDRDLLADT